MTLNLKFLKAAAFNFAHSDNLAIQFSEGALRIRPDHAVNHLGEILQISDVVNFGAIWWHGLPV